MFTKQPLRVRVADNSAPTARPKVFTLHRGFTIGGARGNDVSLPGLPDGLAEVSVVEAGFRLRNTSAASLACDVGDLGRGEHRTFSESVTLTFNQYSIRVARTEEVADSDERHIDDAIGETIGELHHRVILEMHDTGTVGEHLAEALRTNPEPSEESYALIDDGVDRLLDSAEIAARLSSAAAVEIVSREYESRLLIQMSGQENPIAELSGFVIHAPPGEHPEFERGVRDRVCELEAAVGGESGLSDLTAVRHAIASTIARTPEALRRYLVARHLKKAVFDLIFDYGPITDLLRTPQITEIMVNGPKSVHFELGETMVASRSVFHDETSLKTIVDRIMGPLQRHVDNMNPMESARMRDGSRIQVTIQPVAIDGPYLTIRRFVMKSRSLDDVSADELTESARALLIGAVAGKLNIVVAGGTSSGKTTLLNRLSGHIGVHERIVTVEDAAELDLGTHERHVVRMETKSGDHEGRGRVSIRDLVKAALRMRPDRIVVGEVRGEEALDMLQAMNTGHDGSLTTLHANGPADAISRIETMVMVGQQSMPLSAIRKQIASAVNLVVFIRKVGSRRRITDVSEVAGVDRQTGEVLLESIMVFDEETGRLEHTGYTPTFLERLVVRGQLPLDSYLAGATAS